jgi:hypothetical protein
MRDRWIVWGLLPALLLLGALGIIHLFSLRFQIGDLYPPYSSMRTDPVGSKAFYDSLAELPGLKVSRSKQPVERLKLEGNSTLFMLGAGAESFVLMDDAGAGKLKTLAGSGNRVVIGFFPQNESALLDEIEEAEKVAGGSAPSAPSAPDPENPAAPAPQSTPLPASSPLPASAPLANPLPPAPVAPGAPPSHAAPAPASAPASAPAPEPASASAPASAPASAASASAPASAPATKPGEKETPEERRIRKRQKHFHEGEKRWGVRLAFSRAPEDADEDLPVVNEVRREPDRAGLPEKLTMHGLLYFTHLDPTWNVIYRRGREPVVIERHFGTGSVVLAADSYWMINESLYKEPQPALLSWLAGENRTLLFDESHFGVVEVPGVAGLARRYRLHGLVAGLLLLALLFIWMNASSLVPPYTALAPVAVAVRGRDAASGLTNLLRRSVPKGSLLAVCLTEWRKGERRGAARIEPAKLARLETLAAGGKRDPLSAYEQIRRLLAEKK